MTVSATPPSSTAWAAAAAGLRRRFRHHLLRSVRRYFRHGRRRAAAAPAAASAAPICATTWRSASTKLTPARMRKSAFRRRSPARRAPAPAPRPAPSRRPARCAAARAASATPKASSRWSAPVRIAAAAASRSTVPARHAPAPAASPASARLSVNIPAGVEDGTRIRLAGEGEAGVRGGPPGDLYIFLSIGAHPFFQREGADLHCRVPVSMVAAAMGGEFEVPTIDGGKTKVKIPEGTQSGRRFRLQGKGMPVLRARQIRRHVCPGRGRDAAEAHQEAARAVGRIRPPVVDRNAARIRRAFSARSKSSSTGSAAAPAPPELCMVFVPPNVLNNTNRRCKGLYKVCRVDLMPLPALQKFETEDRAAASPPGSSGKTSSSARSDARSGCSSKSATASARKSSEQIKQFELQEGHSARRRGALHPLLDRAAADDRRGDAVGQDSRPRHGALCRSELDGPVVELGPGTGPVTEALVEAGVAPSRLVLVEFNPTFCRILRTRYPEATLVQGDAYSLRRLLETLLIQPAAAVVSGLPLITKPIKMRLAAHSRRLRPDGARRALRAIHLFGGFAVAEAASAASRRKPPSASG